mmetsp:Transcript_17368/g.26335  ORF Transcript_17368/g.26335 Transcript_17368/m.26335 type:complete len:502 (+) Transcript_17368:53-1558(+)|eukprot:CAMPEP_0178938194 /NCGR_PEP_ID=MMETSP0786-20121207/26195_1 /TAXON_ID=186022 /ORGANISM="Thalassionema frauenfeldii, Strain CCMP 1798" /LENGTH=501 /DNA_ID=CAMNT_0020616885 /DNA_START=1 /DNA_END=1506 /DNA_ORIENTATION=+
MDYRPTNRNQSKDACCTKMPFLYTGRNVAPTEGPQCRSVNRSLPVNVEFQSIKLLHQDPPTLKKQEPCMITSAEPDRTSERTREIESTTKPIENNAKLVRTTNVKFTWENPKLRQIPNYYPLETSARAFSESQIHAVLANLSEAFRWMGIHAKYFENPAGAALLTSELVEIHLYLWRACGRTNMIYVELQRRRGDSIIFHRYAKSILDAAISGDFSEMNFYTIKDESRYLQAAKSVFQAEMQPFEDSSLEPIERVADLLQKKRLDARILAMESLSILTNPLKTSWNTACDASRAVLLVSAENHQFGVIHAFILNAVQKGRMSDENTLLEHMIDYDSDSDDDDDDDDSVEDYFMKTGGRDDTDGARPSEYYCAMYTILNYALKTIFNALQVLTNSPDINTETREPNPSVVENFYQSSFAFSPEKDILTSLLIEVDFAVSKPHDACLAAKCLTLMCQSSIAARRRVTTLNGLEIVSRAEGVGSVVNARLQNACRELMQVLVTL